MRIDGVTSHRKQLSAWTVRKRARSFGMCCLIVEDGWRVRRDGGRRVKEVELSDDIQSERVVDVFAICPYQ